MEEIKIKGRAIYTPKGAAREYGRVGCNFYTGCPNACEYCYLRRGAPSAQLGGNVVRLKKCFADETDALAAFCKETQKHYDVLKGTGVFFSFTTDPLIPETRTLTLKAVNILGTANIPAKVLTKDASWLLYGPSHFLLNTAKQNGYDISFGFTLTGRDDMEPNASSNKDRIKAMRLLHDLGFKTWASIEPVIDWQHAAMVIDMSIDCCDHYKIGLRSGVRKDYYDLVQSGVWIDNITRGIVARDSTVYLKESCRALLRRCYKEDYYNEILSRTVDMDGNKIMI